MALTAFPATIQPSAVVDMHRIPLSASPTQNKRKREKDDITGHLVFPNSESPPEPSSPRKIIALAPPIDKGCRLVRTTNVPVDIRNASDAQPAELEWVIDSGTQHPSTLDKKWWAINMMFMMLND